MHEAFGAFFNHEAICVGYGKLASLMLDKLGIENSYVLGYVNNGGYHAWNQVKVDGEYYYLDTTWDDPLYHKDGDVRYKYFLVSTEQLKKTHTWDDENYPKTGTRFNFLEDMHNYGNNEMQVKDGYIYYSSKSGK